MMKRVFQWFEQGHMWQPGQILFSGLMVCVILLLAELIPEGMTKGICLAVAVVTVVLALLVWMIGTYRARQLANRMNDRIRERSLGIEFLQNGREAMRSEWMHWVKRWFIVCYEFAFFLLFYTMLYGRNRWFEWGRQISLLEMTHMQVLEEMYDILWHCVITDMVVEWYILLIPTILVTATFGKKIAENQAVLMYRNHISLKRWYGYSFLTNYLLSVVVFLIFFLAQLLGNSIWVDLIETPDYPFFLRMIGYGLVLLFFQTAVIQMLDVILESGKGKRFWRFILLAVLSLITGLLRKPGELLGGYLLSGGDPVLVEDCTAYSYLLRDIPMGVVEKSYVPMVENPQMVGTWGIWMYGNMLLIGILCMVVGYQILWRWDVQKNQKDENVDPVDIQIESGKVYALVGWEEEKAHALFQQISGEREMAGVHIALPGNEQRNVGYYLGEALYEGLFDARMNLRRIQLWQGRTSDGGRRTIEESMMLAGMDRLGRADNWIIEMHTYTSGEMALYGIAAALLTDPKVLVLEGVLDDLGETEKERVQKTLQRLKEHGVAVLLSCREEADVEGIADEMIGV